MDNYVTEAYNDKMKNRLYGLLKEREKNGEWEKFLNDNIKFTYPLQYLEFIVPSVWCVLYTRLGKKSLEKLAIYEDKLLLKNSKIF